jgi:hypothetical protein
MAITQHIRCPSCQGALIPTALSCPACELTITGKFPTNEFASLGEDDLHFLRIFVLTEGRIRDMESALGVSYPTIKSRMAHLKATLAAQAAADLPGATTVGGSTPSNTQASTGPQGEEPATRAVLEELHKGNLTFEQAMARLKELRSREEK